jgi:TPR repeat protein
MWRILLQRAITAVRRRRFGGDSCVTSAPSQRRASLPPAQRSGARRQTFEAKIWRKQAQRRGSDYRSPRRHREHNHRDEGRQTSRHETVEGLSMDSRPPGEPEWRKKQREYEIKKARAKALKLRLTCSICSEKAKLNCPCETTQYCSTECQRIDWRDRGHRKACKKIRNERAAEAARAEAPTPPPSAPEGVFYGPAPRSHADEVRARIAAEHEAARVRREANPEPETPSRFGSRCPICFEDWDVNISSTFLPCCCRTVCQSCHAKVEQKPCPLCRTPMPKSNAEVLAMLRRHVENDVPEAIDNLALAYAQGFFGLAKNRKKAVKIWKRAVELGDQQAMLSLAWCYRAGDGVKRDMKKTKELLRQAADLGSAMAQVKLGRLLEDEGDEDLAFIYFKKAAEQGFMNAEAMVGHYFQHGVGTERDVDEARRWYERAAARGNEIAKTALMEMDEEDGSDWSTVDKDDEDLNDEEDEAAQEETRAIA